MRPEADIQAMLILVFGVGPETTYCVEKLENQKKQKFSFNPYFSEVLYNSHA
jgi:hypothetical protein